MGAKPRTRLDIHGRFEDFEKPEIKRFVKGPEMSGWKLKIMGENVKGAVPDWKRAIVQFY